MDTRLTAALRAFRDRYPGQDGEHKRLHGWLLDHAPQEKRAATALAAIPRLELHAQLAALPGRIDGFAFRRLTDALVADALPTDLAEQALLTWLDVLGIERPEASALAGPVDAGQVAVSLDAARVLHLATVLADLPAIAQITVENVGARPLRDVVVRVRLAGTEVGSRLSSTTWTGRVDRLQGRQSALLDGVDPQVARNALHEVLAPTAARWWIEVEADGGLLLRTWRDVEVLPPRTWLLGRAPTPALAAFVIPDDPIVAELVAEASGRVDPNDPRPATLQAVEALDGLLGDLGIAESPVDDRVLGPRAVVTRARATRLERQLLLAACLEQGGMPPLLVWTADGPALGLWQGEDRPALTETDDPELVRRLVSAGALAIRPVGDHVAGLEAEPFLALDLQSARRLGVPSLPTEVLAEGATQPTPDDSDAGQLRQRLLDRAALTTGRAVIGGRGAWGAALGRRPDGSADATPPRVRGWKRKLLDLSLRNPLLSLRVRANTLPLLVHDLPALEDALSSGQTFDLQPRPAAERPGLPLPEVDPAAREGAFRAGSLVVDLPEKRVPTAAKNAIRSLREALDEGGVHTLFLCAGLLEWVADPTEDAPRKAPLLLIPLVMRDARGGRLQLKKADGDVEMNPALAELLRREHGVELPQVLPSDAAGVDVGAVLATVRKELAKAPTTAGWRIVEDAWIAIISFSGFRMWRDLDQRAGDLLRHPLVRRLALGESPPEVPAFPDPATLDDVWPPAEVFCPLEADSSQLVAVRAATTGHSFVLEGPPGTGKSQTIANLIAQGIAAGQTVLFVSQKRAALEVVHERLARVGLGPFTLELHSKTASKQAFVQQLKDAAEAKVKKVPGDWLQEAGALGAARTELNSTARALHAAHPPGITLFRALAELEARQGRPVVACDFDPDRSATPDWSLRAEQTARELGPALAAVGPDRDGLDPIAATDWPRPKREALGAAFDALREATVGAKEAAEGLARWLPELPGASADLFDLATVVLDKVAESPRPRAGLLDPALSLDDLDQWLADVDAARADAATLATRWKPRFLELPLDTLAGTLKQWASVPVLGALMLMSPRSSLKVAATGAVPANPVVLQDIALAWHLRDLRTRIEAGRARAAAALGPVDPDAWGVPAADPRQRELVAWVRELRRRATQLPSALPLAADDAPPEAASAIASFRSAWDRFAGLRKQVRDELQLGGGWGRTTEPAHLDMVARRVDELAALVPRLRTWGAYRRIRDQAHALGLHKAVKALEREEIAGDELPGALRHAWLRWWVSRRVTVDPALAGFDGLRLLAREERFAELDRALRDRVRHEVAARLIARQPKLDQGAPPSSQAGILLRQFQQKSRFASPRQLFAQCAGLIRQLKPCVLMSPQSVAQYLDPAQPPFDLVVFDEASQVPVHEAIGAIARGRHVIVVGDSRQLPPTTFFLGQDEGDDEAAPADELVAELESILEECSACGLPSNRLTWHYRSRHPSLIAFSNARYYGNGLQILPTARRHAPRLGVSRVLVTGATYDRGGTSTNEVEARALVDDIVRRLRHPVEQQRSLGVVTFSRAQQALVEDLLDAAREQYPEIEPYFDDARPEAVFVKNLENVQGDERDVVLFGVGYGPDATGRVRATMGPLGQRGGERRLNVAITRAREQLVLFVSFEPADLDLSGTAAKGLHDLKAFLESAATGGDALVGTDHLELDPADRAVQRALATRLEQAGHGVDHDVGVGGYRLDLAIRDPADPERWMLGIELDGPRYAATATARDRDRLRWEVLADLGWRHLMRVRGLDWYEDPDAVVAAVEERIAKAAADPPEPDPTPTPTPTTGPSDTGPEDAAADPADAADDDAAEPEADDAPDDGDLIGRTEAPAAPKYVVTRLDAATVPFQLHHPQVAERLLKVVETEGPVSERLAARRIADAFGVARVPALVRGAGMVFGRIPGPRRPKIVDGFYWPAPLDPATWRGWRAPDPADPATRRAMDDVALEEIGNAAAALRGRYGAMSDDDLARAVAQAFGFRGLTSKVGARIAEALRRPR